MNFIRSKLFRRYLVIGLFISSAGFILAFYLNHLMLESERQRHESSYEPSEIIDIINNISPEARSKTIELMKKNKFIRRKTKNVILKSQSGKVISSTDPVMDFGKDPMKFPPPHMRDGERPPGPPPKGMMPPPPHMRDDFMDYPFSRKEVVLKGGPQQILILETWDGDGPESNRHWFLLRIILIEVIGVSLGVALTILLIYNHFKKRTKEIEVVLNDIRHGKLSTRMPVETSDEFGLAMKNFNVMADEIEALVGKLRNAESTRRVLLGELAHDIRTPLASVRNFIEIVQTKEDKLTPEKKAEIFKTCQVEIEYMTRLVDDLLFLGKIEEPSYRQNNIEINIEDIIQTTAHNLKRSYPEIEFIYQGPLDHEVKMQMDEVLTSRLFRNILDNAFSFASSKVSAEIVENQAGEISIKITDDGPGFRPESLQSFGVKKFSREDRSRQNGKRISIGLGSVIMKRIVELYQGKFVARNLESADHKILGGQVEMILPS